MTAERYHSEKRKMIIGGNAAILRATTAAIALGLMGVITISGSDVFAAEVGAKSKTKKKDIAFEEILVTAQKRTQRLQEVPLSVAALNEKLLEDMGAKDFASYARTIPGLSFANRGPNRAQIVIRGLSPLTGVSTVGLYLDGVGVSNNFNNPDFRLFDIKRVEVLRGPQGTLYGEGSVGGTIKIITNKPDPSAIAFKADGTISSTKNGGENYYANAMVNVPIVQDKLAVRLTGIYRDESGWVDNALTGKKNINDSQTSGVRAAVRLLPSESLSVEAIVNYQDVKVGELNARTIGNPADYGLPGTAFGEYDLVRPFAENEDEKNTQYTLMVNYETRLGNFESVTGYNDEKDNRLLDSTYAVGIPGFATGYDNQLKTFNEEARFVSNLGGAFDFVIGTFYRHRKRDTLVAVENGGVLFGLPGDFTNTIRAKTETFAVFGEAYYHFTEKLQLTVGLRWFREKLTDIGGQAIGDISLSATDNTSVFKAATPKFGLSYNVADDVMLFADAAKGYRSGGNNSIFSADPNYRPSYKSDNVWSYELGVKSQFFERKLTANATAFYTDWKNMQILGVPDNPALGFVTNAGAAHTQGVEVELRANPTAGLNLTFGAGYVEAELDEAAQGAPKGARLANVPKWGLNAAAQYIWPVTDTVRGFARLDWQYKSATNGSILETPATRIPGYHIINARVGAELDQFSVYLFVENLNDSLGITWAADSGQYISRPRTFGINGKVNF